LKKRAKSAQLLPEWRDFEQLVARIEQSLVPKGAVVKSPDHIRDKVTNELREVDASIRIEVGSTPILIVIECRKRKPVQDVTWIEQLATKCANIGAARMIAVSATGFSEPAIKVAQQHGIELRKFEDRIDEEIVQKFLSGIQLSMIVTDYASKSIAYALQDGQRLHPDRLSDDVLASLKNDGLAAAVATEVSTGNPLTVEAIMRGVDDSKIPENGPPVTVTIEVSFQPGSMVVSTKDGPALLRSIEVIAEFARRVVPMPAKALYEYAAPEKTLRHTIDAEGKLSDTEGVRMLVDISSPTLERWTTSRPRAANPPHRVDKA